MSGQQLTRAITVFPGTDADVDGLGKFVVIDGVSGQNPTVALAGAGVMPAGVILENVDEGDVAPMGIPDGGVYLFLSGEAVSAGDNIAVDADGKGITATSADEIVGVCVKETDAADEFGLLQFVYKGTEA